MGIRQRLGTPIVGYVVAFAAPAALTAILTHVQSGQSRDYVFLYLAVVAALALTNGLLPALLAAAVSFLLVDYYFVPPAHTLTIADETDLVNLLVFFGTAGLVGGLASRRRLAVLRAEALTRHLRDANTELERLYRNQEMAARTAVRLAQAQQQVTGLQETDRLRRELLQNVSHELRTPLSSILTGTTAVLTRSDLAPQLREELAAIAMQSRRLDRLVGDLLDMARIEGHALDLHLEPTDMAEAAQAAADRLHQVKPHRQVEVRVDGGPVEVLADWDRLGQIFDNLLGNADRFAPPDTPIVVSVTPGVRDTVVTKVIDRGPGVPAAMRDHVFDRFVRDEESGTGGTGLGLAIVRGLVEAHAGRVWLDDSDVDGDTVFAFALPAAAVAPEA
ncbi:MAG TPA: ATP-binding protein [Candidatus Acidoferrales bacterium]|jgi:K+-sensing histidine kinase KdpD|nr:ATP-binding protein [Candidatus Acidoferrales bacterium]